MGRFVVRQPNDCLAIFSTGCDDFILMNATWEEYEAFCIEEALQDARELVAL